MEHHEHLRQLTAQNARAGSVAPYLRVNFGPSGRFEPSFELAIVNTGNAPARLVEPPTVVLMVEYVEISGNRADQQPAHSSRDGSVETHVVPSAPIREMMPSSGYMVECRPLEIVSGSELLRRNEGAVYRWQAPVGLVLHNEVPTSMSLAVTVRQWQDGRINEFTSFQRFAPEVQTGEMKPEE